MSFSFEFETSSKAKELYELLKTIDPKSLDTIHINNKKKKKSNSFEFTSYWADQKNNGIYNLDSTPVPKQPARRVQTPGHALKPRRKVI